MHQKILLLILFVFAQNLYSIDIQLTSKEQGFYFAPEYNRSLEFCWTLSTVSILQLNNLHTIKSGLAMGSAGNIFDIRCFASGEMALFPNIPIYVSLAYNYNDFPQYEIHSHSILPLASLKWRRIGVSLGTNFRFTSFFNEPPIYEPELSYAIYVYFIKNKLLQFRMKAANYDDFTYNNLGAYFFSLNSVINLNKKVSLINEIEVHQGGSIGLASNFYGIIYRGGLAFLW